MVVEAELLVLPVAEELTVEAGQGPPGIREFLLTEAEADFITQIDSLDYHSVGDYPVSLRVDGELYSSVLHIVDTVPPRAEVQDVEGFAILPRQPEDFVTVIEDATEVKLRFGEEPNLAYIGTQQVAIVFTDQGGNETIKNGIAHAGGGHGGSGDHRGQGYVGIYGRQRILSEKCYRPG